jgi:outer membrane lipoprotein SlyB
LRLNIVVAAIVSVGLLGLAGCAARPSQNVYNYDEVGKSTAVTFGTIVSSRIVDVTGQNTGTGALIGGAAGAGAGSYVGNGSGSLWGAAAGALIGAAVGAAAEQAAADRQGIEYIVVLESGVTMTIVQEIGKNEVPVQPGARVIVQNSGGYQRVLPANNLPTQIARPQGIKVIDPAQ